MHKIKRHQAYLVIIITFFIQVFLSNFLGTSPFKPNLLIIITAFFALFTDKRLGLEVGFLSGLLLDIFSIRFFGLNTILFSLGGYLIGKYNNKFYREGPLTHIILTFAISFFIFSSNFLFVNLRSLSTPQSPLNLIFNTSVFIPSLLNSFLAIWIYAFFLRVFRMSENNL